MINKNKTPADRLSYAIIALVLTLMAVISFAVYQPYTGLKVQVDQQQHMTLWYQQQKLWDEVQSFTVSDLQQRQQIMVTAQDFIEEPHFIESYAGLKTFFHEQNRLYHLLKQHPQILIKTETAEHILDVQSKRTLTSLPVVFWYQLLVCSLGFLLGCWIWALRPDEGATRCFALLNAMYPVFVLPAAIYSTRDLALDGEVIRSLVALNTLGSVLYGSALMSLFLVYPKRLVAGKWLVEIFIFFIVWWMLETAYLFPDPSIGANLPVTIQMLSAIVFMLWQWYVNRHDPRARVALRWFGTWILVSTGLFVFLVQSSQLLGIQLNISQGYSFGFFLLVTIGIAIGLSRYQLFNLDRWAFGILYWLAGAILLVIVDAFLVMMLSPLVSLSLAVLICGLLWLPARGWLQSLLFRRKRISDSELFERVLQISFAVSENEREQHWRGFLNDVFQPLKIDEDQDDFYQSAEIDENGLILDIPQVADLPALRLSYPRQGRGLFNHYDQHLVNNVVKLIRHAAESRAAYDQGVATERQRIARDLHDDLGAKLLSGLYQKDVEQARKSIREAISEMRTIIRGLVGTGVELQAILDELELETGNRLHQCEIEVIWQAELSEQTYKLSYTQYKNYVSIFREVVSNIIKYAQAKHVMVNIRVEHGQLMSTIQDDGIGFSEDTLQLYGNGINNMQQRANELSGEFNYSSSQGTGGSTITLRFPV